MATMENVSTQALDKVSIELTGEMASKFAAQMSTDAQTAIGTGINDDKSKATVNSVLARGDELVRLLVNNGIARQATIELDPCVTGDDKWYINTPFVLSTTDIEDDGEGCCVGTPDVLGCRFKLHPRLLCVKDYIATTLDEIMEASVKQKGIDTWTPWGQTGATLAQKRARFVSMFAKFIFERNVIQGLPSYSGNGMRPFDGLVSRLLDNRTIKIDGSAGVIASISMLDCRMTAIGQDISGYYIAINPILMPTLRQEVRTFLKTDPLTEWSISADGRNVYYRGNRIVESRFIDVDLEENTTSIWLINPAYVGIKLEREITNPFIKTKNNWDEGDCAGSCTMMYNAGTTVVSNFVGLALIQNVKLSSVCDSLALAGLDGFVNQTTLYPKVTANPGL